MAGIGVDLQKLLRSRTYTGLLVAYTNAGLIASGPWVLSMLVVAFVGVVSIAHVAAAQQIDAFMVSVTHLVACSLILTGSVQLLYTRFVADRLFEGKRAWVLPNLFGLLMIVNVVAALLGVAALALWFRGLPMLYLLEMECGFVLLCNVWCCAVFLSGMKEYRNILLCFALAYGLVLLLGIFLRHFGLVGLLGAFVIGQAVLAFSLLFLVLRDYASDKLVAMQWTRARYTHRALILIGLLYNLGIFIDKFLFWYNPATSVAVIGPLRYSPIYDVPLFLAYLSTVPGMAVFLVRMETDFAERYDRYFDAVRQGDTLDHIEALKFSMIETARHGLYEILKIQGLTIAILLLFGPQLLAALGLPQPYLPLFNIDIVAVGLQVLLLAVLNTLFYLDKLGTALLLCALFCASNIVLTVLSQHLGIDFFGYGFASSLALSALTGLALLSRGMERLTFETFMFQPGPSGILASERRKRRRDEAGAAARA